VTLYVPNLIGYVRVISALLAFAFNSPRITCVLYFFSFVCDELDGRFARMLGQSSTFGAVLDMVTDRWATTGLVGILYGRAVRVVEGDEAAVIAVGTALFGLVALDIFSHWFHMYAVLATKGFGTSHKETNTSQPWLLRMYYTHRLFMGFCCVCVEVMYLSLYVLTFYPRSGLVQAAAAASTPGFLLKNVANIVQLKDASRTLVALDMVQDVRVAEAGGQKTSKSKSRSWSRSGSRSRSGSGR
jgi:CDP-diacylglycerol--inositol 3-phosphatidyltransferase